MSTVADIIRDALRHLKVQDPRQPLKPEHARDAVRMLNLMMRRWEADNLAVGWMDVTEPTETVPLPPEAEIGVGYNLAVELQPGFGGVLSPLVVSKAGEYLGKLMTDRLTAAPLRHGETLPMAEGDGCCDVLGGWPRR